MTNGTATIRRTNDRLGREISYDDGAGNVTHTQYDNRDRKIRVTDSAPSTVTYDYDSPAGLPTRVHDSVMGTIGDVTGFYVSDGRLYKQKLPWNMDVEFNLDPTGTETSRYWHWESGWTVQGESTSRASTTRSSAAPRTPEAAPTRSTPTTRQHASPRSMTPRPASPPTAPTPSTTTPTARC
ncbi:hypothetical protein ACLGIH_34375 [Streptomyces sp. HMX87]|uniref:hypothetical protein n=1 Tax=Streptomyces sp. HMX87 TaxID=3390849 RepID=UPI003A85A73B